MRTVRRVAFGLVAVSWLASPSFAAHTKPSRAHPLPKLLQEVEAKYATSESLVADFNQSNFTASVNQTKESSGRLYFQRPDKIRWETLKPDPNTLVSDGKKILYYTPPFDESEHGQLMEKPASQVQTKLANSLLSGSFSAAQDMSIKQESGSKFLMTPKKRGAAGTVTQALVTVDPAQKLITEVDLTHKDGNKASIILSNIELGKKLGPETFQFKVPPNTDLVKE